MNIGKQEMTAPAHCEKPLVGIGHGGELVPYIPAGIMATWPSYPRPAETMHPVYFSRPAVGIIQEQFAGTELHDVALRWLDS